ncbi:MAG: small multi-drug export protein [Eubacteriales bacterium]|nr:small multi-drug export protein [Eubacteriales bacterium]
MVTFWNYLAVFALSAVPVIELKGSIPIGMSMGIPELSCFIVAIFGSIVLSPLIILLTRRVLESFMRSSFKPLKRFGTWQHSRLAKKGGKLEKYRYWFLFILVAIPLPTTGVWTGSMVAGLFDIRIRTALPIIFIGNCVAGLLVWVIWGFATV